MIVTELKYSTNLDSGVQMTPLKNAFLSGDQEAHRFTVSCFRSTSRQPVDLTGAGVTGYFIRADQSTVVISGKVEDNCAVLTLPAACYAKQGRFSLVIKASLGDVIHTILWVEGAVSVSHTSTVIDPGEVVPALDELLARIEDMQIATNSANTAADAANAAATEAVNIATSKGNEALQNVDDAVARQDEVISQLTEEIEMLKDSTLNTETWAGIQKIVRAGLAPKLLPVGSQLAVNHSVYGTRLFDVVAHDYLKSVHDENAHTMTIQQHDLLPGTQFDAPEAFYFVQAELPAGTYNFTLATAYSSWAEGTYQFTLTKPVPKGGQLAISGYADAAMTARQVRSYANQTTTTATESVAITAGSGGTNLGTFGEGLNHSHRVSYGSNNYKESAMRQFLNSSAAAGSVWTPQTKFDRPPSWLTSLAGYKNGLDQDFLAVVGKVVLPCSANNIYEAPDSSIAKGAKYTLNDEFYPASRAEIFGSHDVNDGTVLFPFYEGAGNADRIKYRDGSAAYWWLRTPYSGNALSVRLVLSDCTVDYSNAYSAHGLAPACTIV